jgi:hypothetical protein
MIFILSLISPLRLETHRKGHTRAKSDYITDSIHTELHNNLSAGDTKNKWQNMRTSIPVFYRRHITCNLHSFLHHEGYNLSENADVLCNI